MFTLTNKNDISLKMLLISPVILMFDPEKVLYWAIFAFLEAQRSPLSNFEKSASIRLGEIFLCETIFADVSKNLKCKYLNNYLAYVCD